LSIKNGIKDQFTPPPLKAMYLTTPPLKKIWRPCMEPIIVEKRQN
jgi:hypothetical protein